jgi:hypothetical protein
VGGVRTRGAGRPGHTRRCSLSTHLHARDLPSDPTEIAQFLHDTIGLEDEEIATITGVQPETAHRWLTTSQTPRAGETLEAVVGVIRLLGEPLTSGRVRDFLRSTTPDLAHRSPISALGEGHVNAVVSAAAANASAARRA